MIPDEYVNLVLIYAVPILLIWGIYGVFRHISHRRNLAVKIESIQLGLNEPASLHPVIDHTKCIGCGSCVSACPEYPEHDVLGVIHGKSELITPANCIGHGACKSACPVDAISLVFGTETRGVEIPQVSPEFESNVQGIYVAGELGGMGLVRNAIEQGKQAVNFIKKSLSGKPSAQYDLIIIGAGPAGIASSLAAQSEKVNYLTIEQDSLGGTVAHFPRNKIVMTAPAHLPLAGKMNFRETSKESLLDYWKGIVDEHQLKIQYGERLEDVRKEDQLFSVKTTRDTYQARAILLCLGRRGTPRKLDVPGEEQNKVVYRLTDAEQYRGQRVLVVGGGDSALEAALSLSEVDGTSVTLSYRNDSFARAKQKNRQKIEEAITSDKMQVLYKSQVLRIDNDDVVIDQEGRELSSKNDAVIICVGGILPSPFLKKIGIEVETKYGSA